MQSHCTNSYKIKPYHTTYVIIFYTLPFYNISRILHMNSTHILHTTILQYLTHSTYSMHLTNIYMLVIQILALHLLVIQCNSWRKHDEILRGSDNLSDLLLKPPPKRLSTYVYVLFMHRDIVLKYIDMSWTCQDSNSWHVRVIIKCYVLTNIPNIQSCVQLLLVVLS